MIEAQRTNTDVTNDTFSIPIELIGDHISPEVLAGIGLRPLQEIAKAYSPGVVYPLIKDIKSRESEALEAVMRGANEIETETLFLGAIAKVRLFLDDPNRVDFLLKEGLSFNDGESNSEFIVRVLLHHPSVFAIAGQNLVAAETSNVSERSYQIFLSRRPSALIVQRIKAITPAQIEAALQPLFQKKGYGRFIRVLKSTSGARIGFAIDRAGRLNGREVLDAKDARKTRFERWLRSDYLFFDEQKGALWIHAKAPSDAAIYAEVIGLLIGDVSNFSRSDELDLSFVLNGELPARIQRARSEMAVGVAVRRLEIWSPLTTYIHKARGRKECLTDENFDGRDGLHAGNRVQKVIVDVGLSPSSEEVGRIIITGRRITLQSGLNEVQAGAILFWLGLNETYAHA
jgi:hypothetical protein